MRTSAGGMTFSGELLPEVISLERELEPEGTKSEGKRWRRFMSEGRFQGAGRLCTTAVADRVVWFADGESQLALL